MAPTTADVSQTVTEIQTVADEILSTIEGVAPGVAPEAAAAEGIVNLTATLVSKALAAWSAASGIPITAESVAALLPNATLLTPPTA